MKPFPIKPNSESPGKPHGIAGLLARTFLNSKLTPLFIVASLVVGLFAVLAIPREEDPQIQVPMLDVMTAMPGSSPAEVEQRVTNPIENLMHEISGVEYVYSISSPGQSLVIVRFKVGTAEQDALVNVYSKLYSNADRTPVGASPSLVKVHSIDDVPILALTLWGANYNGYQLRQIAEEVQHTIRQVPDVSETKLIGGQARAMRVVLSTAKLSAFSISPDTVVERLRAANARTQAGEFAEGNQEILVDAGNLFKDTNDLAGVVLGVANGRPVYLRDVADKIVDGPAEPQDYVLFGTTRASAHEQAAQEYPAVTITIAKRKGTNATDISRAVLQRVAEMRGVTVPADVTITTTRNYGATAKAKSDELLKHLLLATLSVTFLIALFLGWRESGVVLLAIPVTLALTMVVFYLLGYTLNRVTLFALIFSIGILVDDAIVVVENMVRHFRLPKNCGRPLSEVAVEAVAEVGNPTILATFTVIAAILPMAFVRGLMGPYMRPIPVGASTAMMFSLIVAFVVSPWAAMRLLGRKHLSGAHMLEPEKEGWLTQFYRRVMHPLLYKARTRYIFLGRRSAAVVGSLLAGAAEDGAGEDAALRQQERVPGDDQHARWNSAGTDYARGAGVGSLPEPAERRDELSDLCGHVGPLQLQWAGAALLFAQPAEPGGHPGEPSAGGCAQRAKPRDREADATGAGPDCAAAWRKDSSVRGTAGTARAANSGGRNLWTESGGTVGSRSPGEANLPADQGRG